MNVPATVGALNYLAQSVKSSLYRNGEVLTRRDRDGSDAGTEGVLMEELEIAVNNARALDERSRRTIETHGFELLTRPLARSDLDFYDHQQVVQEYYAECAQVVQESTGAARVFAFDHNIRSASGKESKKRIAGGQQVQGPARIVHGDYTLTSAPQRLRDLANPPGANDTLRSVLGEGESLLEPDMVERALDENGRFAIINLWRNIAHEPVAIDPLALCDGQTVNPEDLVVFEIHYHDRIGENYFAKHAPQHGWWYYPAMIRDEVLLIKQWDSAGELARSRGARADSSVAEGRAPCTFSFHSAFKDPATPPDSPDRQSIEVRCIVLFQ
ncbi:MAG: hypothetical protein OES46_20365 [Gammaproteobacteria bacterium]|nr:hypothetical protein [Gammaproteobacteria bacterium]